MFFATVCVPANDYPKTLAALSGKTETERPARRTSRASDRFFRCRSRSKLLQTFSALSFIALLSVAATPAWAGGQGGAGGQGVGRGNQPGGNGGGGSTGNGDAKAGQLSPFGGSGGSPGADGGDTGGTGDSSIRGGGGGGGGGSGQLINNGATISTAVTGSAGGAGGIGIGGGGGGGGGGGDGVSFFGGGTLIVDTSAIVTGGAGGSGFRGGDGGGGGGGAGVVVDQGGTLNVRAGASVTGGAGGGGIGAAGGSSGAGVILSQGGTITVDGSIAGGSANRTGIGGGAGVVANRGGTITVNTTGIVTGGFGGPMGVGITGADLNIIARGAISGGAFHDGTGRGNAITFTGGTNSLMFATAVATLTGDIGLTGSLSITGNGTTLGSAITGTGSVNKVGSDTLTLTGANSYIGSTTISSGVLRAGANNTLSAASDVIVSGGTLDLNGFDQTIKSLAGRAGVSLGSATLTVGGSDTDTRYDGVISGAGGLTKSGSGKLTLSGVQTYAGATNVNAGNLNVNGSLESSSVVNVNKGGTLSGNGKFGNITNNGGVVSPGNSIGTMIVNGNLNMGADSEYHVEINGTKSDLIQVSGTANILSATFSIGHDTDPTSAPVLPGKTYTILTTGGGLANTSPAVGLADFPFLNFSLHGDGFNAYLTTSRSAIGFADLASTPNERAVANALETTAASNPVQQQVMGASEAQARAAFTSLSHASIQANAAGVLSAQSQYLRDAVTGRLRQDLAYGTPLAQAGSVLSYADEAPRNAYASLPFYKAPPAALARPAQVYSVWAQALGSMGKLKGDGNAAQTDHSLGGVISGIDVTFNGIWRVGLAGGYSRSSFKSPDIAASGTSDSYHIAAYGGGQFGAWGVRGGASFSWNDLLTSRQVAVVHLVDTQRGDYGLKTTQVFGEVGHTYAFSVSALEPFLNVAYVRVDGGINELGLAAMTGSTVLDTTYATLGLRGATALTQTLTARGTLGWRHAFGDVTPLATLAFQSGSPFTLAGSPIARDALVAEAGFDYAVAPNAFLGVSWSGQFADQSHANAIKGHFSWRF